MERREAWWSRAPLREKPALLARRGLLGSACRSRLQSRTGTDAAQEGCIDRPEVYVQQRLPTARFEGRPRHGQCSCPPPCASRPSWRWTFTVSAQECLFHALRVPDARRPHWHAKDGALLGAAGVAGSDWV